MTGHTPGPWKADPEYPYKVRDASGQMVGVAIACVEDTRLIAAAPSMYEALTLIAAMHGKTLLNIDLGQDGNRAHQIGANAAFNQLAEIASDALAVCFNDRKTEA